MKMILRWFPHGHDSVPLEHIRQVPGVVGVATCLPDLPPGEAWPRSDIEALRREIADHGLSMEVIESVNVHEDIKKGLPTRDRHIENYVRTLGRLGAAGVRCVCYNFMPVMDWVRSDLAHRLEDDSTVLSYRHAHVAALDPARLGDRMSGQADGFSLPGWEPARLRQMAADMDFYRSMPEEAYWEHLRYFLAAAAPAAEAAGIALAIHPDDPPWPLFGLPKLLGNAANLDRLLSLHDSPAHGLAFCTGSLGADANNDLPAMAAAYAKAGRLPFAHLRNIRRLGARDFDEAAHYGPCGDVNLRAVVRALAEAGFSGYIRPDHGRMIWGETGRPGYGLYDRALGTQYLLGLWDAFAR